MAAQTATPSKSRSARHKEQEPSPEEILNVARERFLEHDQAEIEQIKQALEPPLEHVTEDVAISDELKAIGAQPGISASNHGISETPAIVLPLTQSQVQLALHQKVVNSLKWLAIWCIRVAKLAHNHGMRVIFGEPKNVDR